MPALTLHLLGLALGLIYAWAATEDLRQRGSALASEAAWLVLAYSALLYTPCCGTLLSFHADWSVSYWLATERLPMLVTFCAVVSAGFSPFAGYLLGAPLARERRVTVVASLAGAAVAVCVVGSLITLSRLLVDASYVEYHNDFGTQDIAGSALGYALLWMSAIAGAASSWTVNALRHLTRNSPPAASGGVPWTLRP